MWSSRLVVGPLAAGAPGGVACGLGKFSAFSRKGASRASGGQLDFVRNLSRLGRLVIEDPLKVHGVGHHVVRVASPESRGRALMGRGSTQSASRFFVGYDTDSSEFGPLRDALATHGGWIAPV